MTLPNSADAHYAPAQLAECSRAITTAAAFMASNRADIDAHYTANRSLAEALYAELQRTRLKITECVRSAALYLLELGETQLAEYAGGLAAQLDRFNLTTRNYTALVSVLNAFAEKLPTPETTNAAVIGRLMNKVRMGHYPTDLDNVGHIKDGIAFPPGVTTNLLDPCCGEGTALKKLAVGNNCMTYGVELDESRAAKAQDTLHRVGFGSYYHSRISAGAFHLLFLNPPYLSVISEGGGRTRDEKKFLIESYDKLIIGGLLIYIIPYYRLTQDVCRVLAENFTDISVHRFTDSEFAKFNQIVVMGTRIPRTGDYESAAVAISQLAFLPDSIPRVTELAPGRYALPAIPKKVQIFKGAQFNELELARQLKQSRSLDEILTVASDDSKIRRPPLPFSFAQLGLVGGSGLINGLVECDTPHIIKGRIIKENRVKESENRNRNGDLMSVSVKETRSNKMVFNILTPEGFTSLA